MIDYFKIHSLPVNAHEIIQHDLLTFPLSNIATTGEILNRWQVAHWRNLQFKVKDEHVRLEGSLHKYTKNGINHDDFFFRQIINAINELTKFFNFDPGKTRINFIEISVTLRINGAPSDFIDNLIMYKTFPFKDFAVKSEGHGRFCELQQFVIKIYDKSLKERLVDSFLRFEIKIEKMEFLRKFGFNQLTLLDLMKIETYYTFKDIMLQVIDNLLLYNPELNITKITNQKDHDLLLNGKYCEYWKRLPRQRRLEQLKRFKVLTGPNNIGNQLRDMISQKWQELISDKITTFQNVELTGKADKITVSTNDCLKADIEKSGQNNPTINSYLRTCPITGMPIQMQKPSSRLLSNTGLKWLRENDPQKYETVRRRFLPRAGYAGIHTKYERNEFYHLSKQIRNIYYTLYRPVQIPENQLSFFSDL